MKSETTMTIRSFAKEIGVSPSLVSMAFTGNGRISPESRERILLSAQELGFSPNPHAQRLSSGRGRNTIGLFSQHLNFGAVTLKAELIQSALVEKGFDVPLYACGSYKLNRVTQQAKLMNTLRRQQPRAIICATGTVEPDALEELNQFQSEGGIVVCHDYRVRLDCDQVFFDREDNTYQTARHLLELGHRDIGLYMEGADEPIGERKNGFTRALNEVGLQPNPKWMFHGESGEKGGALLAQQFLALKSRPTGLCIVNDPAALTFINEVQRANVHVPQDVSVVGHDNMPASAYGPVPLTTNTHPVQAICEAVIAMICSRLDGSYTGPPRQQTIYGELIVRQSTQKLQ